MIFTQFFRIYWFVNMKFGAFKVLLRVVRFACYVLPRRSFVGFMPRRATGKVVAILRRAVQRVVCDLLDAAAVSVRICYLLGLVVVKTRLDQPSVLVLAIAHPSVMSH